MSIPHLLLLLVVLTVPVLSIVPLFELSRNPVEDDEADDDEEDVDNDGEDVDNDEEDVDNDEEDVDENLHSDRRRYFHPIQNKPKWIGRSDNNPAKHSQGTAHTHQPFKPRPSCSRASNRIILINKYY